MSRLRQFNYRRWLPLGLIVLIPLLLLFTALRFVQYEQQESIHHVNVAVVNQDQPASFQGKTVDLGSGVLDQLKHNDQIDWHFVSESVADQKLANGQYLMKITLPKDFSQNATTALSTAPKQSTIDLSMSDHNNFASHMITTTVAQQLQSEVTTNVQKAYDKTLLQAVNQLGDGVKSASAGTTKLAAGTKQLNAGLATLQSKTKPLGSGVFQLLNGSQQLEAGATKLVSNNDKLNNGAQTLNSGVNQLAAGSQTLQTKLTEAASEINSQLTAAKPDLAKLDHGFTVLNAGIKQLANGVNGAKVNVDSKKLKTDLVSVANAGTGAGKSATAAGTNLQDMSTKLFSSDNDKSVATQMTAAGAHFTKAGDAMTKLSQMGLMKLALQLMPGLKSNLETIQKEMLAGKTSLTGAGDSLKSAGSDAQSLATNLKGIGTALTPMKGSLTDVQKQLTPLNKMLPKLTELRVGVNQLADQKNGAPAVIKGSRTAIRQLQTGLATVSVGLTRQGTSTDTMGAIQGAEQLHNGLAQVQAGLNGDSGLVSGLSQYTNGTSQIKTGSDKLTDGLSTLNGKVPTLTSGVTKLADGASKINAGVSTLNVKLNDGAKQVQQLNDSPANVNHFVTPVTSKVQQDSLDRPIISLFTPLVLLLTLFVGAIILELTLNRYSGEFNGLSLRRKLIGIGSATLLQSLTTMLLLALMGIPMAHPFALFVILALAIISFTTITFAFDRYLGTPGVLFTLLLVFIQLILSGGLLPNAMLAKVHQFLGAFMPGTYVLNGLNYALNGLDYSFIIAVGVLLLFTAAFIILAFLPDYRARHRAKTV